VSGRAALAGALLLGPLLAVLAASGEGHLERAQLAFCNGGDVRTLDPARATSVAEGRVVSALFDRLVRLDPASARPRPGLARSWTTSDDAVTWTFRLREDARFSHGRPVVARDVVDSLRRVLEPATGSPMASLLVRRLEGAAAWVARRAAAPDEPAPLPALAAPSPHAVVMRLAAPCPFLPEILALPAFAVVPVEVVAAHGPRWTRPAHIATSGPFRLVEHRLRDRLRLARFEEHWDAASVALGTVDVLAAESLTTQLNLFLTGEVDWMGRPPRALLGRLEDHPAFRSGEQLSTVFVRFNTRRAPLDSAAVRRALALALDRGRLVREVLGGRAVPASGLVPRTMPGYAPPPGQAHAPDRARALLARAGHPGGTGLRPLVLLSPHNEDARDLCTAVAEQWRAELGVACRLVVQPWPVYLDGTIRGEYDLAWSNWTADYAEPSTFLDVFRAASPSNRTGFADAAYDARLDDAARAPDAERAVHYARAEARLLDAAPITPLHWRTSAHLVAPRVRGFRSNPLDVHPLHALSVEPEP